MNKPQIISAISTLALSVLLVVVLLWAHLRWQPGKPWPPEPEPYIELEPQEEEFVEPEVIPLPVNAPSDLSAAAQIPEESHAESQLAPETGTQLENRGQKADSPKEVTTKREAPAKMEKKEQPKKQGPAVDNEKKEQEAAAKRTNSTVKNAFNNSKARNNATNGKKDEAVSGRPDGKPQSAGPSDSKSSTVGVEHGNLRGGWVWPAVSRSVKTSKTGSIIVEFTIDSTGRVTGTPKVIGGKAPAASDAELKSWCVNRTRQLVFTRSGNSEAPAETQGRLTFTFSAAAR